MSKRIAVFVDGSNLFYLQLEMGWRINMHRLLEYIERSFKDENGKIISAIYYTPITHEQGQENFLGVLTQIGFSIYRKEIKTIKTDSDKTIKKSNVDVEIAIDMVLQAPNYDIAVLISGDGDFCYALQAIKTMGKRFVVMATRNNVAKELLELSGHNFWNFEKYISEVKQIQNINPI